MNIYEFISSMIEHLAWPMTLIVIIKLSMPEIKNLLANNRILKAKYKGIEVSIEKDIQEIKQDAENAGVTIMYPINSLTTDGIQSLEAAPEWAFIQSWQEIEKIVGDHYKQVSGMVFSNVPFLKALAYLEKNNFIDNEMAMLIGKIRNIRNKIVHGKDAHVTKGEAIEWLGISKSIRDRLIQKLKSQ